MLDRKRLGRLKDLLAAEVKADRLMGCAVQVSCGGEIEDPILVGRRRLDYAEARVETDTIFLVASITKPIVCAAVVKLLEQGELALNDPVARYVPEFGVNGKETMQLRHLLTHTSGLPDQIEENRSFREAKKPLSSFVARICELAPSFEPGTRISYQSSGIAILGEVCERITGVPLADYLKTTFFDPIGLRDTALKMTIRSERESEIKIAGEGIANGGVGTDHDWNSDYWRGFGAPWGGMLTTVEEMTRLLLLFKNGGELDGVRVLSEASVRSMREDHSSRFPKMAAQDRARQRWGLGWRLSGPNADIYGNLVSDDTFGHGGATGTLAWVDPVSDVTCVIFTNDPAGASSLRGRISNIVSSAICK